MNSSVSSGGRPLLTGFSGIAHAVNSFVRPIDHRLFAPAPLEYPGPLFIVGLPRSGSTLTYQVLTQYLSVSYLPKVLDYGYGCANLAFRVLRHRLRQPRALYVSSVGRIPGCLAPSEAFGYWRDWFGKSAEDNHHVSTRLPDARAADLRAYVFALQGHLGAPLLVKCLYLSLAINVIAVAIPESRFIFVTREPISVIASMLRVRKQNVRMKWWSVRPPDFQRYVDLPLGDQVVWQYATTKRLINEALDLLPETRRFSIRFEDLCSNPAEATENLFAWLAPSGYLRRPDIALPEKFVLPQPPTDDELRELNRVSDFADCADQA